MRLAKWWISAALFCAGFSACGDRSTRSDAPKNRTAPALPDAAVNLPEKSTDAAQSAAPEEPEAPPVSAVRTVLRGVDAGRLEVLAEFLPASYQQDVEALVRVFAEKMPEDVWTRWHTLAEKGAALLKKHPHLGEPTESAATDDAEFRDQLATALDTLTTPKAWDRAQWQKFELQPFLQGPGSAVFTAWQKLSAKNSSVLSETKIQLQSLNGDRSILEFQSPWESGPRAVDFALVEGKWIPKSLSDAWPESVRKVRADLDQLTAARIEEMSARIRPKLLQIERTLDQMLAAERPHQVQLGWWQIQSLLVQSRQELAGNGPPPRVEIRITGELSESALTELLNQLVQTADQPDAAEYLTFPTSTGTVVQLSPVADFEAFTQRLTFVTVKSHDVESRRVEIERRSRPEVTD